MQVPDLINGAFELSAGFMVWINTRQAWKDHKVYGVHWLPTMFFTSWGVWNLFYYPHLDQWCSFWGGVNIVIANIAWLYTVLYFWGKR